ncbi:TPA: hypothetical protein ACF5VJ_004510, partial [Escherichia coli]
WSYFIDKTTDNSENRLWTMGNMGRVLRSYLAMRYRFAPSLPNQPFKYFSESGDISPLLLFLQQEKHS